MEAHLVPTNALLGLVTPGDINRAVLADAGFRVVGLEIPAIGSAGKVVIDVLLLHDESNHFVQCESKSGANVEERQAKAYAALTADAVVRAAGVSLLRRTSPSVETLYVCSKGNLDRIRTGMKAAGVSFPILTVDARRLDLRDEHLATGTLREPFAGGVQLDGPPARIIPFDLDSSARVVHRHVLATMVAMLSRRIPHVSLTGLTEQTTPHYVMYGQKAQNSLRSVVGKAVAAIALASPDKFAFQPPSNGHPEGLIRFIKTPEDAKRRGRTQSYQALGRPRAPRARTVPVSPAQLDLLAELDATEPAEDDTLSAPEDDESNADNGEPVVLVKGE